MNSKLVVNIGSALMASLTLLAALPYQLGPVAEWVPPEWKPWVVKIGLVSTVLLRITKAIQDSLTQDQVTKDIKEIKKDL